MLDLREHKALSITPYNVLDDITSHWEWGSAGVSSANKTLESAHTQCTDKLDSFEHCS